MFPGPKDGEHPPDRGKTSYGLAIGLRFIQQLPGALQQGICYLDAAGDAGKFRLSLFPVKQNNACKGPSLALPWLQRYEVALSPLSISQSQGKPKESLGDIY